MFGYENFKQEKKKNCYLLQLEQSYNLDSTYEILFLTVFLMLCKT